MGVDEAKRAAGDHAAEQVEDGQIVGLGSGTTAARAVEALGRRVDEGLDIVGVPTSQETARLAEEVGIELVTLEDHPEVDVTLDGADEVTPDLQLIKGLGGALVRERIVAASSDELVILVDPRKLVDELGERAPVPVEVVDFGRTATERRLASLGGEPTLRTEDGEVFVSDNGNPIVDLAFPDGIESPRKLDRALDVCVGVVDHGIFLDMADRVVVGREDGSVETRRR